nr:PREDICTED: exocyst complex component EXO70B1-like [Musa acuminata subsp. malaccensis]
MECNQPLAPRKSSSFSSGRDEKRREIDRNFSLGTVKLEQGHERKERRNKETIQEEEEEEEEEAEERAGKMGEGASNGEEPEANLITVSGDIDNFLAVLLAVGDGRDGRHEPPEIPESTVEKFVVLVEEEMATYETGDEKWPSGGAESSLLDAIDRVSKLTTGLRKFSSEPKYQQAMNRSGTVLHQAMCFLEDEFHSLLQDARTKQEAVSSSSKTKPQPSFSRLYEFDRHVPPSSEPSSCVPSPAYPPEAVERLHKIADAMISAGYDAECCQVFAVARRNAFEAGLPSLGFEKVSIEDVLKMAWESLESEIATWIKAFRHTITASISAERELCEAVFASHRAISDRLFRSLAHCAIIQLLTFAEAVTMTKRSAEKLFKVLDIYEAMRDVMPIVDALLPDEADQEESSILVDPKTEISSVRFRLGEAAVAIFCELESSIKADSSKTPVPGGAVHPLTRYVTNYLKYACEYKNTLEQVFKEHRHSEKPSSTDGDGDNSRGSGGGGRGDNRGNNGGNGNYNPFAAQLVGAMDLLHSNLESKSKLYKDLALSNIFLMNNGRYVAKKVKGLDPGRQTEKYIKFGAEDLENLIDELFDGNPSSMASKRRT